MGWMQALLETYDNYFSGAPLEDPHPLVPVGFIEEEMHIRVNLLPDGTLHSAAVIGDKCRFLAPTTPMAEGRTGTLAAAYPLCDELRYMAGDLSDYADADYHAYFDACVAQLSAWCCDPDAPTALQTFFSYINRGTLTGDLIACGVLRTDENGGLIKKWPGKGDKPAIYQLSEPIEKCVADFCIQQDDCFVPLREMAAVRAHWQKMLLTFFPKKQICYASSDWEPVLYNHPKIEGNAKLISAKDGAMDFQYRGRFTEAEQAYSVGYVSSAKAHNALRWLRARQGYQRYGSTFITWSTACHPIIAPQDDAEEGWGVSDDDEGRPIADAETYYGIRVRNALLGYQSAPAYKKGAHIVMLGMEAATPGRMSITYYQELDGSDYLNLLEKWYTGCVWLLPCQKENGIRYYVTTPTLREISEAVFGTENMNTAARDRGAKKSTTKQIRSFNARLLYCIANGLPIPRSAATAAFRRACQPMAFTRKGKWNRYDWHRCLAVACAMQKSIDREGFKVALNTEEHDASYLFGRLVAVADCAEMLAMADGDSSHRQTNAIRYFSAVQQHPGATWAHLENKLIPYLTKLGWRAKVYTDLLDEIIKRFGDGELTRSKPLTPNFLQGYHCQREAIRNRKEKAQ